MTGLDGQGPMAADFHVFLSAVTSEFGLARDVLANDLQARDLQLRVQRSFRQEPGADTLLRLLHDYIRDCGAVVCVIGARSGACPSPAEAATFAHLLPPRITEASMRSGSSSSPAPIGGGYLCTSPPPTTGRTRARRPATISPNCRTPSWRTSRRWGCTTRRSPTATSCAPKC